jgi:hypothetical protein
LEGTGIGDNTQGGTISLASLFGQEGVPMEEVLKELEAIHRLAPGGRNEQPEKWTTHPI